MASARSLDISSITVRRQPRRGNKGNKKNNLRALTRRFLVVLLNGLLAIGLVSFSSSGGLRQGQPQPEFSKPLSCGPVSSFFLFAEATTGFLRSGFFPVKNESSSSQGKNESRSSQGKNESSSSQGKNESSSSQVKDESSSSQVKDESSSSQGKNESSSSQGKGDDGVEKKNDERGKVSKEVESDGDKSSESSPSRLAASSNPPGVVGDEQGVGSSPSRPAATPSPPESAVGAPNSSQQGVEATSQNPVDSPPPTSPAGVSMTTDQQQTDSLSRQVFKYVENKRKEAGMTDSSELLYKDDVYRLHYSEVHPVVLEENADLMFKLAGYKTFIDDLRRDPKATIYFASDERSLSEESVGTVKAFCPEAKFINFGRIRGMKRTVAAVPSSNASIGERGTAKDTNVGVVAVSPADDPNLKGPLVAIIQGTLDCMPKLLWRDRLFDAVKKAAYVVDDKLSPAGKQYDCWMAEASTNKMLKWKLGYARFLNIVERAAQAPDKDFSQLLSKDTRKQVLELCRRKQTPNLDSPEALYNCFFKVERSDLCYILGHEDLLRFGSPLA